MCGLLNYKSESPEVLYIFAHIVKLILLVFKQDHNIHIHRHWAPCQDKKLLPQVFHMQFHGREVHSLCFIDPAGYSNPEKSSNLYIATGCEDGTMRLTG